MNNDFIVFSLPEHQKFYILLNNDRGDQKIEFSTFDDQKKIVFQNHTITSGFLEDFSLSDLNLSFNYVSKELFFNQYLNIVQTCIDEIKKNSFKKIVISRIKKFNYSKMNFSQTLKNLRIKFPKAFIYFFVKNKIAWLGATPELLGKLSGCQFETTSLAGTTPQNQSFHSKEINEQKMVTNFIESILKKYSRYIKISSTSEYYYNNLKHLVTNFSVFINPTQYEKLVNELHPTPAVCGVPQKQTLEFIQKIEPHRRELYCGKIKLNLFHENIYFVNIRCLKLFQMYFDVFVGGGITSHSIPEDEWNETEMKAKSIVENLVYD